MMAVLIKSMKMPKNCEECDIKSWDTEDYVCPFSGVSTLCISRQANCPLIEVPPHGRLIDADVMRTKISGGEDGLKKTLIEWVDAQETVIEAERSE